MRHFVDDKLLIEAMTPNLSPCPRRCVSREMRSRVQGDVSRGPGRDVEGAKEMYAPGDVRRRSAIEGVE